MPPKKAAAKANTSAKAAAVPSTVTTSRGKEYETTAAAGRPKRERTSVSDDSTSKAIPKKKAATATTAPAASKKRGRPAKEALEVVQPPKKRGRPAKEEVEAVAPPKKRGRPAKEEVEVTQPPKKRGRPANAPSPAVAPTKKRGRPAKAGAAPAVSTKQTAPPKKRGRPPTGGETTKIEADEEAAAEQLEEELVDAVEADPSKPTSSLKRGRGRPSKAAGSGKQAATLGEAKDERIMDDDNETVVHSTGKSYWLMKAEQEDREETLKDGSVFNAKFTIDDLRERNGPEPWDGVRNPTACKNMKNMKLGDEAFFYASGGKKGRVPGITGIMEVVKEAEPDTSAFDENSPFYVDNDKMRGTPDKPRWMMVHVEYRNKLTKPVPLTELKKFAETGRVLSQMQELTAARLSVSAVTKKEWDFIVNELIEGYEEDMPTNVDGVEAKGVEIVKTTEPADDEGPNGTANVEVLNIAGPTGLDGTSSRPASRAASRAGSKKPGSRAGSLAPAAGAKTRGRSRTPLRDTSAPVGAEEMEVIPE